MPDETTLSNTQQHPVVEPRAMQVLVGGLPGFATLATAANTAQLRATGRASLYTHVQAVVGDEVLTGGVSEVQTIQSVFASTGPGVAELDIWGDPSTYFRNVINGVYSVGSVQPTEANVNLTDFTAAGVAEFKSYVDTGRAATTVQNYAPIFSPNDGNVLIGSFADPQWDAVRAEALYGGGLALDTPPQLLPIQHHSLGPADSGIRAVHCRRDPVGAEPGSPR